MEVFQKSYKSSGAVISLPEQLVRSTEQNFSKVFRSSYESVPEQLRKCSGAVSKCSGGS